ncbi:MAG: hypothetical protein E6Q97_23800 [Desulfurellales bacterium]|nr:MAG: hypothetical protein E6Q97_23800 [Desulfurellales bacterium]
MPEDRATESDPKPKHSSDYIVHRSHPDDQERARRHRVSLDRQARGLPSMTSLIKRHQEMKAQLRDLHDRLWELDYTIQLADQGVVLDTPQKTIYMLVKIVYPNRYGGEPLDLRGFYEKHQYLTARQAAAVIQAYRDVGLEVLPEGMPPIRDLRGLVDRDLAERPSVRRDRIEWLRPYVGDARVDAAKAACVDPYQPKEVARV